ncbi:SDR family NAD(P)-dependent oxidoreductase [Loktanella sp. M215]|nr:SDR family NAD(P)-dependent oxidoreductase [Loktanella sp. M215]
MSTAQLAVVTGASTGIGLELAKRFALYGHDLIVCANESRIVEVAEQLRTQVNVEVVEADTGTRAGIDALWSAIGDRDVDYLCANAGIGLGHAFLEQDWDDVKPVIDLNVAGTTALLHRTIRKMRQRGEGRILITGSIAGLMPGSFQAVYNATKAYLDNLSWALRNEVQDTGITVTCLMPGPTDTEFFSRAGMEDTPVGQSDGKADPAAVAKAGYDAMMRGSSGVTPGMMNKIQAAMANILPDSVMAQLHRRMAEPNSGGK